MKPEVEEPIEGVSIERYAGIAARLDVQASSGAAPDRLAVLEEEQMTLDLWGRVHASWQARIHEEIARASTMPSVPVAERYPVVMRYGAAYAKAKRSFEEPRSRDADEAS